MINDFRVVTSTCHAEKPFIIYHLSFLICCFQYCRGDLRVAPMTLQPVGCSGAPVDQIARLFDPVPHVAHHRSPYLAVL